jgi:hypothetical protein
MKEGEKLKKKPVLITLDVIEECLHESLDVLEKGKPSYTQSKRIIRMAS